MTHSETAQEHPKPVIGLAGGIGSGKSTVADLLEELGARTIDSDFLVGEELQNAEVVGTFRGWWGDRVCDSAGRINRKVMGDIIFAEAGERSRMESFLYPRLERRRRVLMEEYNRDASVRAIVINAPLLYEVGLDRECDVVIFVDCPRRDRLQRLRERRGWNEAELERREKVQKSLDIKARAADHIVVNNSTVDALRTQIRPLFERLISSWNDEAVVGDSDGTRSR